MWNSRDGGNGEGRDQGFSSTINLIPWGITYIQEHKLNISVTYNSETSSDYRRERERVVRLETWPVKREITMISSLGIVHKCWHAYPSLSWRVGSLVTLSTRLKQPLPLVFSCQHLWTKGGVYNPLSNDLVYWKGWLCPLVFIIAPYEGFNDCSA